MKRRPFGRRLHSWSWFLAGLGFFITPAEYHDLSFCSTFRTLPSRFIAIAPRETLNTNLRIPRTAINLCLHIRGRRSAPSLPWVCDKDVAQSFAWSAHEPDALLRRKSLGVRYRP